MKIRKVELTKFKRFTHLIVDSIPESARLVIMGGWSSSSAIQLSPSQIRTCGFPAYGSSRRLPEAVKWCTLGVSDSRTWQR